MRACFPSPSSEALRDLWEAGTAKYQDIEEHMIDLNIENEENEGFVIEGDIEEKINKYELCLIGRFVTEKNINTRAMKTKMADI